MKKLLIMGCVLMLGAMSVWAWDYIPIPPTPGNVIVITRITTSETLYAEQNYENAYDLGDTTNTINAKYGGEPFTAGTPVQVEVFVAAAPEEDTWDTLTLQYVVGTNSETKAWTTISTITSGYDVITNVVGCHFGLTWVPPAVTNYLIRIHGITDGGIQTANLGAQNITKDGDGVSWFDSEVVGFTVTDNTRPGVNALRLQ
jgi:hypothetical protein